MTIGTAPAKNATKVLLLGSGELGKEVAIEAIRLGCRVVACDKYENAPAMQVAQESRVFDMLDPAALERTVKEVRPDYIVPEVEAIATETLLSLEKEGFNVVPNAKATVLTMNREGIRRLAAEELKVDTTPYRFAETFKEFEAAVEEMGMPCVVKPIMSSSGRGQSVIRKPENIKSSWDMAQTEGRSGAGKVIVEAFIDFDYEITLLTIRHRGGTAFLDPVGHLQKDGDYQESWQPQPMTPSLLERAQEIARTVTDGIGGWGIFGVELFIKGDKVFFSEVSPRPHDTGMVTMISQNQSEFELHVRAFLGLPLGTIRQYGPAASAAVGVRGDSTEISYGNIEKALDAPDTSLRIFGKPGVSGHRRMAVTLALGESLEDAREKARNARDAVEISLN
nr:formate-dependent phosphoribosylglycinamide formyltransferase [uncultured Sphaerochaeta sp.]